MIEKVFYTFPRRELTTYERMINFPRIVGVILIVSAIGGSLALIGRLMVGVEGNWIPPITFGLIAITSLFLFLLNRNGYYTAAGFGIFFLVSGLGTYNIAIFNGIYDVGIFIYPLLIVTGSVGDTSRVNRKAISRSRIIVLTWRNPYEYSQSPPPSKNM